MFALWANIVLLWSRICALFSLATCEPVLPTFVIDEVVHIVALGRCHKHRASPPHSPAPPPLRPLLPPAQASSPSSSSDDEVPATVTAQAAGGSARDAFLEVPQAPEASNDGASLSSDPVVPADPLAVTLDPFNEAASAAPPTEAQPGPLNGVKTSLESHTATEAPREGEARPSVPVVPADPLAVTLDPFNEAASAAPPTEAQPGPLNGVKTSLESHTATEAPREGEARPSVPFVSADPCLAEPPVLLNEAAFAAPPTEAQPGPLNGVDESLESCTAAEAMFEGAAPVSAPFDPAEPRPAASIILFNEDVVAETSTESLPGPFNWVKTRLEPTSSVTEATIESCTSHQGDCGHEGSSVDTLVSYASGLADNGHLTTLAVSSVVSGSDFEDITLTSFASGAADVGHQGSVGGSAEAGRRLLAVPGMTREESGPSTRLVTPATVKEQSPVELALSGRLLPGRADDIFGPSAPKLQLTKLLGRGGFGSVFEARDLDAPEKRWALKVGRDVEDWEDEAAWGAFFQGKSGGVCVPEGGGYDLEYTYLVFPLAQGDMKGAWKRMEPLGVKARFVAGMTMMVDVLDCLIALHGHGVVHHDIKPDNILVFPGGKVALGDLGMAEDTNAKNVSARLGGTPVYCAPEKVLGQACSFPVDIWAVGIMVAEFITGRRPFGSDSMSGEDLFEQIVNGHIPDTILENDELESSACWRGARLFIQTACHRHPGRRPTARGARDWMEQIRQKAQEEWKV